MLSRFSTDEVVVKDTDPLVAAATAAPLPNTSQPAQSNAKLLSELQEAQELFDQLQSEGKTLLRNNTNSSTDELVAMADFFLIMVNSLDLERYLEMIQSLQRVRVPSIEQDDEGALREQLKKAAKSMSKLHHVFLRMVERCTPLNFEQDGVDEPPCDRDLHSPTTVGRALQLSRRAEELGLPPHRPLYQRLAMGILLTKSWADDDVSKVADRGKTRLIMPGQLQAIKEGTHTPPLSLELLNIFQHARSALQVSSQGELQQLAEDLLAEPFLMLLKQKQYEDCMGLLRGGWSSFGFGGEINLTQFLGEDKTIDALNIAKDWLADRRFGEEVALNPLASELAGIMEHSLAEILQARRKRAQRVSEVLSQLSATVDDEEDDEDFESDSDYEDDDFDYESDDEDEVLDTPTPTEFSSTDFDDTIVHADHIVVVPEGGDSGHKRKNEEENDARARESAIYLRNQGDWTLPDIVQQLEDWNKGEKLTFTTEFSRYLSHEMMQEEKGEGEE
ncbi:hypothetical protein ACHAXT_007362 [Thalassiosira profunda]